MGIALLTPPAVEPIDIAELRRHLSVDGIHDDPLLAGNLATARVSVEVDSGRALVCQQLLYTLDGFPVQELGRWGRPAHIVLPRGPLLRFESIQYTDTAGAVQTLGTNQYLVDQYSDPARVCLAYGKTWPATREIPNAVQVRYLAGYVTSFTVDVTNNMLVFRGRNPSASEELWLTNSGGHLPQPLQPNRKYTVTAINGNSCSVSDELGVVTLTSEGEGLHFVGQLPADLVAAMKLMAGHLYENREASVAGGALSVLPMGYESLVWHNKDVRVV